MNFVLVFFCNGELAEIQQRLREVECTGCQQHSLTFRLKPPRRTKWSLTLTDLTGRGMIDGRTLAQIISALADTGNAHIISFGPVNAPG
ncbi:MAG: hypothetical protein UY72_C0027G0002 [Candidatus Uhrbacteria bacterium GW2011_GWD2_52_7]|uniref:Uncharacterized protein n=1 Tax=Candidatus Uhrbacteria bacterium GW2011_GWD2_52_7 TaxID=1618989 RepID=A0A0G1XGA9_9BACT|nr:MAG: hypothetical protein UY72_C0027G0002 [Candidatus Uhrbacteria bacterium GW2011_GWD2_52_7]